MQSKVVFRYSGAFKQQVVKEIEDGVHANFARARKEMGRRPRLTDNGFSRLRADWCGSAQLFRMIPVPLIHFGLMKFHSLDKVLFPFP